MTSLAPTIIALAALLCGLTAGLVFTFAVVVMPGIRSLPDADFVRAFQVIDGVIQNNHPLFGLVWLGSILATVAALVVGGAQLAGLDRLLVIGAGLIYLALVQAPTFIVNVPLNNRLQQLDLDTADDQAVRQARSSFEARWNRWNGLRTAFAIASTAALLMALVRL